MQPIVQIEVRAAAEQPSPDHYLWEVVDNNGHVYAQTYSYVEATCIQWKKLKQYGRV